jgi:hypothetical protein
MANITISSLPSLATMTDATVVPSDSGNSTQKISGSTLKAYFQANVPAANISGNTLPNTVLTSSLTSVGTLGSLSVTANANVGNLTSTGVIYANNNILIGSTGSEGGQIVMGYVGVNNFAGQANSTWNMDVDASNNFRIFSQIANGATTTPISISASNSNVSFPSTVIANGLSVTGNTSVTTLSGNVVLSGIQEDTTGTSPLLLWDDANFDVGYDSTVYYNHATETLHVGNLGISDTVGATGVAIETVGDAGAGTLFINANGNGVISFTDDRRVKWALLAANAIPSPAAGSMIYNNDVGNAANGFYVCVDGTGNASWDKVMAAKGNVVTLPGAAAAPTAVAGGIYYNDTTKQFFMCANATLGWQSVNLT